MLARIAQLVFGTARDSAARALAALGVGPNAVTVAGTALTAVVGVLWAFGWARTGALVLVAAAYADMLDGAVARLTDSRTSFGAFLDSTMDRVSDFFLFAGPAVYYARRPGCGPLAMVAVAGFAASALVSYTRARAEALGASPSVGFWQRPERAVGLFLGGFWAWPWPTGSFESQMPVALVLVSFGALVTAVQRVFYTRLLVGRAPARHGGGRPKLGALGKFLYCDYDRREPAYQASAVAAILLCTFLPAGWVLAAFGAV
jgi:CDP-diacylglycerol--glycerol-3-phosphate 3-phosphatidyltransferase